VEVPQEFSADPINIDTTLKPVDLQNIAVHSQMAPSFSKIFPYLEVSNITESTVPQSPSDNLLMHKNFMHYLTLAWFNHFSVILSPDIIFYTILAEVADEILTEPDTYRHLFTDSFDKKIILTETSDPTKIDLEQVIAGPLNLRYMCRKLAYQSIAQALPRTRQWMRASSQQTFRAALLNLVLPCKQHFATRCPCTIPT
jgi:hypothetical protein